MLGLAISMSGLVAAVFAARRIPALAQLSKLSQFRARVYRATRRNQDYDYESDPLLMNDRDD